jgi:hypothetical protein
MEARHPPRLTATSNRHPEPKEQAVDFRDAWNTVTAELTPRPWEYTDPAGTTLTVIPAGLREERGYAEVMIRVTASRTQAAEVGITTTYMVSLLHALDTYTAWEHATALDDELTVGPAEVGMVLTVTDVRYDSAVREFTASIRIPEAQVQPLASALRRAADVARGWES